mmetsp:Transcript_58174/g.127543  ORF Transcript_58174/g.127543 Transcript_58174/m.127543 type:complete len:549 (+) Transcript_58174:103-1749(+)
MSVYMTATAVPSARSLQSTTTGRQPHQRRPGYEERMAVYDTGAVKKGARPTGRVPAPVRPVGNKEPTFQEMMLRGDHGGPAPYGDTIGTNPQFPGDTRDAALSYTNRLGRAYATERENSVQERVRDDEILAQKARNRSCERRPAAGPQGAAKRQAGKVQGRPSQRTQSSTRDSVSGRAAAVGTRVSNVASSTSVCDAELAEYSDRFLPGYDRKQLLGKGGCAVVWAAVSTSGGPTVAVKQVAKGNGHQHRANVESAKKEITQGDKLFDAGGVSRVDAKRFPGINHICRLFDFQETKRDLWLVMEYGGTCLTKMIFEIKGEFHRGERIYRVHHLPYFQDMKRDLNCLKHFLRQMCSAFHVLASHEIVHSDIKPDNILVDGAQGSLRLIDFGSSYDFSDPDRMGLGTPEYMPPEALQATSMKMGSRRGSLSERLYQQAQPWSFDMWSLGAILLELCMGAPLWLSYKSRIVEDDRSYVTTGIFAAAGRDSEKIVLKQAEVLRRLPKVIEDTPGVPLCTDPDGVDLLMGLLAWDPLDRISPEEALHHPFLAV